MMESLTKRQLEALQAVAKFWRQGRAPTTGELLQELGITNVTGLGDLLRPIERKGYLTIQGGTRGRQRHIELTPQGRSQTGFGLPILGEIPAGPLAEAIQQSDDWIESAGSLLSPRSDDFFLRVKGDSMIGAGILTGDLVLLRPNVAVRSGEVVAAQICESEDDVVEATLKHLDFLDGGKVVRLRAANPDFPDREFPAHNVTVAGVFRGLIREFGH
jgi:repressor LexA